MVRWSILWSTVALVPGPMFAGESAKAALFGDAGYLTRADLDKIHFAEPVRLLLPRPDFGEKFPDLSKLKGAVVLPKASFKVGEAIPVFFVIRSERDKPWPLQFRSRTFECSWPDGYRLQIIESGTKKPNLDFPRPGRAGGGREVPVPSGYHVTRAELLEMNDAPLPPGKYEIVWSFLELGFPPIKVEVLDGAGAPKVKKDPATMLSLASIFDQPKGPPTKPMYSWEDTHVVGNSIEHFAVRLATGVGDKYYPDPRRLPNQDHLLRIAAEWIGDKESERLKLTFEPVDPAQPVVLPFAPYVMLMGEFVGPIYRVFSYHPPGREYLGYGEPESKDGGKARLAPKTLEIRLPKDWQEHFGMLGKARLSVVVERAPARRRFL